MNLLRKSILSKSVLAGGVAIVLASILLGAGGPLQFTQSGQQGFGDRHNSWAWSMKWWNGRLYVGTNRAFGCVRQWELHRSISETLFPYPPNNPSIDCTPNPADLPLQAEIWTYTPAGQLWSRIYQSPADLANPDSPGKTLSRDIGYRTMTLFQEGGGTQALYVGAVNSQPMWNGDVPAPRILRSTDGINFTAIPHDAGTFMANLPYSTFRSFSVYNGSLFVVNAKMEGQGILLQSSNPSQGNNAWSQVSPEGIDVMETEVFNGFLYVGTFDARNGYSVLKTNAQGTPPYAFTTVIPPGAFLSSAPGHYAWSMAVVDNQLYVGAGMLILPNPNNSDLIRINPDDTWDLIAGKPRDTPAGFKVPLSGLPNGFGNEFTDGLWSMQNWKGALYIGGSDESGGWQGLSGMNILRHLFGFDFYSTRDGVYVTQISNNGFRDDNNYGISRMADTPLGLFVGATNMNFGLEIWRNSLLPSSFPAPGALQLELQGKSPVLSWSGAPGAVRYHIRRAPIRTFALYPGLFANPAYPGPYQEIATTEQTTFIDSPLAADAKFLYFVMAEDTAGNISDQSNLVYAPPLSPPSGFASLLTETDGLLARIHFASSTAGTAARKAMVDARALASALRFSPARMSLDQIRQALHGERLVAAPYNRGLRISIERLMRRLELAEKGMIDPRTL